MTDAPTPILRRRRARRLLRGSLALLAALAATAADLRAQRPAPTDSALAVDAVRRFHAALARGDSTAALALLAPDAVVLESGDAESRAEYRAHHLPADIEFAAATRSERHPLRVEVRGDAAWVASSSETRGRFRGRAIDSLGTELIVLRRAPAGWRIAAIHWSSHARRPAPPAP